MEQQFIKACDDGDLAEVDRLLLDSNLDVHARREGAFRLACSKGHLLIVNRLLELEGERTINVHVLSECAFEGACSNGHLDIVNRLLELKGERSIDVKLVQELIFDMACYRGHLPIVNRLLELEGERKIDVHTVREKVFRSACKYGRLNVVKRLLELTGDRSIKLSEPSVLPYISEEIKILIIKALLKKMKRLKLLDELLKQKVDIIEKKELVMGELRAIPGGHDYIQAESSFVEAQLN